MSFKILHSFTINVDKEVVDTVTTTENGQEVITKTKTVKAAPFEIVLKEPSRRERQDIAMFQTIVYNDAITKNLLPKVVMQQRIGRNSDSPLSGDEDKNIASLNQRLRDLSNDYMRLSANTEPESDELKARKQTILADYMAVYKKVVSLNTAYESVYAHTAENYTQTKTLSWLTLFLTYVKGAADAKPEPMFPGADFAAKEQRSIDLEEAEDALYKASLERISLNWMRYLFGVANKTEDFVRIEEEQAKQAEVAAKIEADAKKSEELANVAQATVIAPEPVSA